MNDNKQMSGQVLPVRFLKDVGGFHSAFGKLPCRLVRLRYLYQGCKCMLLIGCQHTVPSTEGCQHAWLVEPGLLRRSESLSHSRLSTKPTMVVFIYRPSIPPRSWLPQTLTVSINARLKCKSKAAYPTQEKFD